MTIEEMYREAVIRKFESLILLIEWLVYEKGVSMERDSKNISFVCEKYGATLHTELAHYKEKQKRRGKSSLEQYLK
ncbi:hypothetical protein ACERII_19565 [Evansella sp. AB-rgal1]|uniref:hypothetical protein n=1 Tax=Evansella sp. AB-rgal1 TaxID=3242696 RepID=UPI00359CBB98